VVDETPAAVKPSGEKRLHRRIMVASKNEQTFLWLAHDQSINQTSA
jgi:hypothetical protein